MTLLLPSRFGAERVLLVAGSTWALLTFFFQNIISWAGSDLRYVVLARAIFGGAQGVHFPALASISSRNLNNKERTFFFSATSAGSAMGALFTGTVGSYANEAYGWPYVFYIIGKKKKLYLFSFLFTKSINRHYIFYRIFCTDLGISSEILCHEPNKPKKKGFRKLI